MSRALEIGLSPTVGSSQRLYSAPTHASPHRCLPAKTETTRPEDKEMKCLSTTLTTSPQVA